MKKFLLILLFALLSVIGFSQDIVTHRDWTCVNKGAWGSFYWKVNRTQYADAAGKYWFYVIAYSNSYFNTQNNEYGKYDKAITYISKPTITMYASGYQYPVGTNGVLVDWEETQIGYFFANTPNANFDIKFYSVTPYNYSMIK